jgi:RNA polymerase sigma-70 factor (ECF subfamily)
MSQLTDGELIDLGRRGEATATSELFERHYPISLKVARRILRCEAESQDAVQTAYCAAFEHLGTFRGESSFRTWITRIVVNRCLMAMRHPWNQRRVSSHCASEDDLLRDFASPARTPEMSAWNQEVAGALKRAFCRLAPPLRAAYSLYALSEAPVSEVATSLGLTVPAAKSRIFRARSAMRLSLKEVWSSAPVDAESTLSRRHRNPGVSGLETCISGNSGNAYVIQ